jgi:siroheme synthase-like protein
MDAFPAFFPLTGRTIIIVGSGEPAEAKARLFAGSPARLTRLSGEAALEAQAYDGAALVFVADADPAFAAAAARAARNAGAPVNVTDQPALCDFFAPAVIDRGEVVAAVGTGGASPMLAAMLRNDIEARVPDGAGRVAALFRLFQDKVRAALPQAAERRAFLRDLLHGPVARTAMAGDMDQARRMMDEALAAFTAEGGAGRAGQVSIVLAGGPVDLLSLRAARLLSQADALVVEAGATADVAALARRDARRIAADDGAIPTITALARDGLRVVWAAAGDAPPIGLVEALGGLGVASEVLRPAPA